MPNVDRRDFLKYVGASAGAAATVGCSDPVQKLIPYVIQPEEITPGLPTIYASTCQECPAGCGLHVTTREGRPVKLEGNPEHPVNRGTLCARGQASIGRTYHPDRYQGPLQRGADGALEPISWDDATKLLASKLREAGGRTWLLGGETGPTESAALDRFASAIRAGGRVTYEPFAPEALRAAARQVFDAPTEPVFDLSGADFILDFGSDFLEVGLSPNEHARQLAEARDADDANTRGTRLTVVGPRLSMTASAADEWVAAKPGTEGLLALAILRVALANGGGTPEVRQQLQGSLESYRAEAIAATAGIPVATIERLGKAAARAKSPVALPPGVALSSRRATGAAGAVLVLNWALGATGGAMKFPASAPATRTASYRDTLKLLDAMKGGRVAVLLVHDSNPAYSLPPSAGFAEGLAKVPFVVSFASMPDETSEQAHLILPDHTSLESWGDAEPRTGVRSLVQPSFRPLYDTRGLVDTLFDAARAMGPGVAGGVPEGSFRTLVDEAWSGTDLHAAKQRGGVFGDAPMLTPTLSPGVLARLKVSEPKLEGDGDFALVAVPSAFFYDGRGASLPWLQEIPDPVTKISWDSWAEISTTAAERLGGLASGDLVEVKTGAGTLEVPVLVRTGLRDDVIAIAIGQGHTVGQYASRQDDGDPGVARGVNVIAALPAQTDESGGRAWFVAKASAQATGGHRRLPYGQASQDNRGRKLGEAVSLLDLAHGTASVDDHSAAGAADAGEAHGGEHGGHIKDYDPALDSAPASLHRWGMSIDTDRCTGCSACVAACYIENNIPVVGEESVLRGRNMAWLRIERYVGPGTREAGSKLPFVPDESSPDVDVRNAPMLCQHCGAAPCEPVCPVIATNHSEDGLNVMTYNRCIGTRYCSNNCSYKVRKYNWFDFQIERLPEPMHLMSNPDVTVRGQGVMEKCTFCVQRIQAANQPAKDEGRAVADGEVIPACAQSCPTQAIKFGNLRDASSTVSQVWNENGRVFHALQELNTRPAIAYLKKVVRGPVEG